MLRSFRDPSTQDGDIEGSVRWVDVCFQGLLAREAGHWWVHFVDCIDIATRTALPGTTDSVLARKVRRHYARLYADLDAKLDEPKVVAAVKAWRARPRPFVASTHWAVVRVALLDAAPMQRKNPLPAPKSMGAQWSRHTSARRDARGA